MSRKLIATSLLALSMFFTGASGLVNEYVLSTVSTYILGSSIEQFSITIALMLGMMGIGSWSQKYINDNNLIEKFINIELLLALISSFAPILVYAAFGFMSENFNLIYYLFVISIGFLIGFEIPFIIRINKKYSKELKSNISTVIASDYIGSFIGALVWVYLLLPNFGLNEISFIVSGVNLFVALITFIYFSKIKLIKVSLYNIISILVVTSLLIFGFLNANKYQLILEQKIYEDPIIDSITTKYQHITMTNNKKLNEKRLYINGNVQFSTLDEKRYHEILVHPIMSFNKKKKDVLILGGGDGLVIRELKKYKNINSITLVDLDPGMIKFAKTNKDMKKINENAFNDARITILNNKMVSSDSVKDIFETYNFKEKKSEYIATVNVINIDASKFIHILKNKKFDVIIIDFPDPSSIELVKLYSKEFYLSIKNILKDDGSFVIQSTSPYHAKETFLCIGRTLKSAGLYVKPYHLNIPSFGDWGWWIGNKLSLKKLNQDISNVKKFYVKTKYLTPEIFSSSFLFGKNELNSKYTNINTLMKPVLLDIYTKNSWLTY